MLEFGPVADRTVRSAGLVPFLYESVPPREGKIVNSIYLEAMSALPDCRAVVVVARGWNAAAEWNFGIAELASVVEEGRHGLVYLVSEQAHAASAVTVPEGTIVRVVRDADEFEQHLREDLAALMRP